MDYLIFWKKKIKQGTNLKTKIKKKKNLRTSVCTFVSDSQIQSHAAKQHNGMLFSNYATVYLCRRLACNPKYVFLAI